MSKINVIVNDLRNGLGAVKLRPDVKKVSLMFSRKSDNAGARYTGNPLKKKFRPTPLFITVTCIMEFIRDLYSTEWIRICFKDYIQ